MGWDKLWERPGGKLRITRSGVAWILGLGGLIVYDVVALNQGWGTLSAVADGAAHRWPILAFAVGVVCGHLFWNNWKE